MLPLQQIKLNSMKKLELALALLSIILCAGALTALFIGAQDSNLEIVLTSIAMFCIAGVSLILSDKINNRA